MHIILISIFLLCCSMIWNTIVNSVIKWVGSEKVGFSSGLADTCTDSLSPSQDGPRELPLKTQILGCVLLCFSKAAPNADKASGSWVLRLEICLQATCWIVKDVTRANRNDNLVLIAWYPECLRVSFYQAVKPPRSWLRSQSTSHPRRWWWWVPRPAAAWIWAFLGPCGRKRGNEEDRSEDRSSQENGHCICYISGYILVYWLAPLGALFFLNTCDEPPCHNIKLPSSLLSCHRSKDFLKSSPHSAWLHAGGRFGHLHPCFHHWSSAAFSSHRQVVLALQVRYSSGEWDVKNHGVWNVCLYYTLHQKFYEGSIVSSITSTQKSQHQTRFSSFVCFAF